MADIFLSYAREDLEAARAIVVALEAAGWSVFWDQRIPPAQVFEDYIEERINESRAVVVLWSPQSVTSRWVRIEAAHGRDRNPSALVPAMIESVNIPFAFRHLQTADLRGWKHGLDVVVVDGLVSAIETLAPRSRDSVGAHPGRNLSSVLSVGTVADRRHITDTSTYGRLARFARSKRASVPLWSSIALVVCTLSVTAVLFVRHSSKAAVGDETTATSRRVPLVAGQLQMTSPASFEKRVFKNNVSMIWIPRGEFDMGSLETELNHFHDEDRRHVKIENSFWLDQTEVTNEAFARFLDTNESWAWDKAAPDMRDDNYLHEWYEHIGKEKHPVTSVSWYAASAFCKWIGGRLPSEVEWEYAARARTSSTYWWGPDFDPNHANHNLDGTVEVGDPRHLNPWGLSDMLGNVQEWTASEYLGMHKLDRKEDPSGKHRRVLRGGSWMCSDRGCLRAAYRNPQPPNWTGDGGVGFRCAL